MRYLNAVVVGVALGMIGVNPVPAASSLVSTGTFVVPYQMGGRPIPWWSNGALVMVDSSGVGAPSVFAVDRQGRQVFAATLLIPDSLRTYPMDWTRGTDGTVAVCGTAWSSDGRDAPFIALFSPDGLAEQVIRTEPYHPYLVALAPDGTVWVEGFEMINGSLKGTNAKAGVIRQFDRSGKLLGDYIPGTTFPSLGRLTTHGRLIASADRIGWANFDYRSVGQGSYVEILRDGTVTSVPLPGAREAPAVTLAGLAMTGSNDVVVAIRNHVIERVNFYELDRIHSSWVLIPTPAEISSAKSAVLFGADGADLVLRVPPIGPFSVRFYRLAH